MKEIYELDIQAIQQKVGRPAARTAPPPAAPALATEVTQAEAWTTPGFAPMTPIPTSLGPFPAQTLRVRDRIRLADGGFAEIRWLDRLKLSEDFLRRHPEALPIQVQAGALGRGLPHKDLVLSPGQPVATGRPDARIEYFRIGDLTNRPGIRTRPEPMTVYTLFHCGTPVVIEIEGVRVKIDP